MEDIRERIADAQIALTLLAGNNEVAGSLPGELDIEVTITEVAGHASVTMDRARATIARLTAERDEARRERDELEQFIRHQGWDIKAARPSSEEGGG